MNTLVTAPAGRMRGTATDRVRVFRGVPYAEPPLAERRFAPPVAAGPWDGVRDCTSDAPIPPQGPSRLKDVVGDFGGAQSEDCLSLTVWAPPEREALRPVMVFVHGGAYMSGAGSLACHDAAVLADTGDVVVVAPNFRVGALGFLYLPGVSEGNQALLDLALALRWVSDNIAAFGGDPRQVTVFGQSSGASSIRALMAMPAARRLFQRAIVQSGPLGRPDRTPEYASEIGRRYAGFLGLDPQDRAGFQQASVAQLLAAQGQLARSFAMPLGTSELPFTPVVDGRTVRADGVGNWFAAEPDGHALMVGSTAHEMAAFHAVDPAVLNATHEQVVQSLQVFVGDEAASTYARWASLRGDAATPAGVLCDFHTARLFGEPSAAFALSLAEGGVRSWLYRFDWPSPTPGLGACHCIELPFVFNNLPRWQGAGMVAGAGGAATRALAEKVLCAWASFAHSGEPGHAALPAWPPLGSEHALMVLDTVPSVRALPA